MQPKQKHRKVEMKRDMFNVLHSSSLIITGITFLLSGIYGFFMVTDKVPESIWPIAITAFVSSIFLLITYYGRKNGYLTDETAKS